MAITNTVFQTGYLGDPIGGYPGEILNPSASITIGIDKTELKEGLVYGTFIWYDQTNKVLSQTYSDGFKLIGILRRDITGALDINNQDNATNRLTRIANILKRGLVLVKAKENEIPKAFDDVYANATTGEATVTATDEKNRGYIYKNCSY